MHFYPTENLNLKEFDNIVRVINEHLLTKKVFTVG